jgi:hypothetical protein
MKLSGTLILAMITSVITSTAHAQLQLATDEYPACVFGGATANIHVVFANASERDFDDLVRTRIFQATSATAVPVAETSWKRLRVLPGQTVLESARMKFPPVKAPTKFLVRWTENTNRVIGTTEVRVYPTNLLAGLKPLLGEKALGVLDPNSELKPLLKQNGVQFVDLEQMVFEEFSGRLAILGPFRSQSTWPENAVKRCKMMATNGVAVLWLRLPDGSRDGLHPSYYSVVSGTNNIVVAQSTLVDHLPENPESQLRLVALCRHALQPEPMTLIESYNQP